MANEAARLYLGEVPSTPGPTPSAAGTESATSAWPEPSDTLALVLDGSRFEGMMAEAASWADRITVCVTAPHSQHGDLPWWGELLARGSKCDRIYLRRAEQAEGWLLYQLHETGALRLLDGGGRQVASNLLLFSRAGELRVLLSHIPFERAVAGAAFGTLLAFRGSGSADFARSCRVQLASWTERARIPVGSEIDALAWAARRAPALPSFTPPVSPRIVADPVQMEAGLKRLLGERTELRAFAGGYRVMLRQSPRATPFVLTLHAGAGWCAGNGVLLEASDNQLLLAWRGGLLGHSRARAELLWSEARLHTFPLEDSALGSAQRVALVAHSGAASTGQVEAFLRELARLGEAFNVEPPPALGHALAEFSTLAPKQQLPLLWRALLGTGPLAAERAVVTALEVLRDQGYLPARGLEQGGPLWSAVAERLNEGVESGLCFDRVSDRIRAIQPEPAAYTMDDWRQCLLQALPADEVVPRRRALRLAHEHARDLWGLAEPLLARGGALERALEAALASALARGSIRRVGAEGLLRASPLAEAAELPAPSELAGEGLIAEWSRALKGLAPLQRLIVSRRAGGAGERESLEALSRRLGAPLERVQQLEADAWQCIAGRAGPLARACARLTRALAGTRFVPVSALAAEDTWWRGVEHELDLLRALCAGATGGELHVVTTSGPCGRAFVARFEQFELERAVAALLEQAAEIATPASLAEYTALAAAHAAPLDPALGEYLLDVLEARLELDPDDGSVRRWLPDASALLEEVEPEPYAFGSESSLRLEDAIQTAFRIARAPLSRSALAARVRLRMDAPDDVLEAQLARAPFARLAADEYGLLARDVAGGPEAIASALCTLLETLTEEPRALEPARALELVRNSVSQPWSLELLRSLAGSEPALCALPSGEIALRCWQPAGSATRAAPVCPGLPASAVERFAELLEAPLGKSEELARRVRSELGRLERSIDGEDFYGVSLARQLCDLHERLLEHALKKPGATERLAQAAARHFLERVAQDEDEPEPAILERERLLELRGVLEAVLVRLELDWL
jgi:hypothetical protein